jgi:saccharopine dehydrogenase-like NADP-dependent oxidoreductase
MVRAMTKAIVLGGGMVGSVIARDLAREPGWQVTVADVRAPVLERLKASFGLGTAQADLADPAAVRRLAGEFDVVVGALSSTLGLQTLRAVIEAGKPYCDISFMAEDATSLSSLAEKAGVTAVVDCGVAPGLSNLMVGWGASQLDPCQRVDIYVGGLPVVRRWPYHYQAGFAPADVIEEYTRPARLVEHGKIVTKEALTEPELLDFDGVGTLEAFNTDGLRSLLATLPGVPEMREKTLRYPGHIELMRVLRHTGLFSKEPLDVKGQKVRPLDVAAALLFPKWMFEDREADLTVMRVVVEGKRNGGPARFQWDLLDRYDPETNIRSMSRTTAFPAAVMARWLATGKVRLPGVHPPEVLGRKEGLLDAMLRELEGRGVKVSVS